MASEAGSTDREPLDQRLTRRRLLAVLGGLLICAEALIGLAALTPKGTGPGVTAGLALILAIWLVPQNFGQISTGQAPISRMV